MTATHSAREFADALQALLPPGAAWQWPAGGLGDSMLLATAQELARIEAEAVRLPDHAIETHRPKESSWHISAYQRVVEAALGDLREAMPRKPFAVGAHVGDRVWSAAAPTLDFPITLVKVKHLLRPLRVGSRVGDALWSAARRYTVLVYYYRSVVDPKVLFDALQDFKQAHVDLRFIDITGVGGEVIYGQD